MGETARPAPVELLVPVQWQDVSLEESDEPGSEQRDERIRRRANKTSASLCVRVRIAGVLGPLPISAVTGRPLCCSDHHWQHLVAPGAINAKMAG